MRLKEAHFADAFCTNSAGSKVCDATGFELDAHIGNVDLRREDGQADGMEIADRRLDEAKYDIEIVDHEVENDIYIERAGSEDTEAMDLKKQRPMNDGADGEHGWIEALKMANLKNSAVGFGKLDESVGFAQCGGYRLFDEDIDTGTEQATGDVAMKRRGHTDGSGMGNMLRT